MENKKNLITTLHEAGKATRFFFADANAIASLRHTTRLSASAYIRKERRSIVQAIALILEVRAESLVNSGEIRGGTKC
jgi:hypothetical protein